MEVIKYTKQGHGSVKCTAETISLLLYCTTEVTVLCLEFTAEVKCSPWSPDVFLWSVSQNIPNYGSVSCSFSWWTAGWSALCSDAFHSSGGRGAGCIRLWKFHHKRCCRKLIDFRVKEEVMHANRCFPLKEQNYKFSLWQWWNTFNIRSLTNQTCCFPVFSVRPGWP